MEVRKVASIFHGVSILFLVIGLAVADWKKGLEAFTSSNNRAAVISATVLIIFALVFLFIGFVLDMVLLYLKKPNTQVITGRFVFIYIGVGLVSIAVLIYTAAHGDLWPYFFTMVAMVFATLVAIFAALSCTCQTQEREVNVDTHL